LDMTDSILRGTSIVSTCLSNEEQLFK
jgi:hypothetical protein